MTERPQPHYLILGEIVRAHGVIGEVRLRLVTDYPERLRQLKTVYLGRDPLKPNAQAHELASVRLSSDHCLIRLRDVNDRNQAELLRGLLVMVKIEDAVPLEEDEFYAYELIGMSVQTHDGLSLGTIREVMETGANDVYIINSPDYGELLVPAHGETILKIDLETRTITMSLPDGLLPTR
ncbi:MAG: ribosome maturation factor RimM [Anaerolineae bacterium]|nr:ribosome maturation factor RimM [Anaerolineae bacterium]MDW8173197.1 ribosome maturation factor RimM [Anaerolineae bacterium]